MCSTPSKPSEALPILALQGNGGATVAFCLVLWAVECLDPACVDHEISEQLCSSSHVFATLSTGHTSASVNSDKKGSSTPFHEHSPLNLSGPKIRKELLSPDILLTEGLALCTLPSSFICKHVPLLGIMRVLAFASDSTKPE